MSRFQNQHVLIKCNYVVERFKCLVFHFKLGIFFFDIKTYKAVKAGFRNSDHGGGLWGTIIWFDFRWSGGWFKCPRGVGCQPGSSDSWSHFSSARRGESWSPEIRCNIWKERRSLAPKTRLTFFSLNMSIWALLMIVRRRRFKVKPFLPPYLLAECQ